MREKRMRLTSVRGDHVSDQWVRKAAKRRRHEISVATRKSPRCVETKRKGLNLTTGGLGA